MDGASDENYGFRVVIEGRLPLHTIQGVCSLVEGCACAVNIVELAESESILDGQQRTLIGLVEAGRPISSIELAQRVGLPRGSVRSYCAKLVKAGLATRLYGTMRNSESRFVATDQGRRVVAEYTAR